MKNRFLAIFFAAILAVSVLAGCAGTNPTDKPDGTGQADQTTKAPNPDDPYSGQFRVGHGRVNITPQDAVPMAGYGDSDLRLSTGFLDYIYTTCVAITDENDDTLLMFTVDILASNKDITEKVKEQVSAATGVPVDHILFNASHSHSSIDSKSNLRSALDWNNMYKDACAEAARTALADRLPAKMYWTSVDLTGYNYNRHYFTEYGEAYGVNHSRYCKGTPARHTYEANHIMFLVNFVREGGKDVMLSNWRCHSTMTSRFSSAAGQSAPTNISSDWVGMVRAYIEKQYGNHFVYLQGDSGTSVGTTSLAEEYQPPKDYKEYAREVADIMIEQIDKGWEEIQTGPIVIVEEEFEAASNKEELEHVAEARLVYNKWQETHNGNIACAADPTHYIQSQYHAGYLISRSALPATMKFYIAVGRIGDLAFTQAPFETFDTNGNFVRDNSPTKYTFVLGYSNEHYGYLASAEAWDYGCYETDTARIGRGAAEDLASRYVEILNDLYKNN